MQEGTSLDAYTVLYKEWHGKNAEMSEKKSVKEKESKNFFEEKRKEWMDSMDDSNTASEIAQWIRALVFAIPEGKKPRTEEETHQLYDEIGGLVKQRMVYMRIPGMYGSEIRYAKFYDYHKQDLLEYISKEIPRLFFEDPVRDLASMNELMRLEEESFIAFEERRNVINSSDRLEKFASSLATLGGDRDTRRFFIETFAQIFEPPERPYRGWSQELNIQKERAYKKDLVAFEKNKNDDAFFDAALDVLTELAFTDGAWHAEVYLRQIRNLSRTDQEDFFKKASAFAEKGISAFGYLDEHKYLRDINLEKDGLEMFHTQAHKRTWLDHCLENALQDNSDKRVDYAKFVKEALNFENGEKTKKPRPIQLKGISPRMAEEMDQDTDEAGDFSLVELHDAQQLCTQAKNFLIKKFNASIAGGYIELEVFEEAFDKLGDVGVAMVREFDLSQTTVIKDEHLSDLVYYLGRDEFKQYLPNIHKNVYSRILALVGVNLQINQAVASNFQNFIRDENAEFIAHVIIKDLQAAKIFYENIGRIDTQSRPWVEHLIREIESLYPMSLLKPPVHTGTSGTGGKGFMSMDPFEKHPFKYGGTSMQLQEVMSLNKTPEQLGLEMKPETVEFLHEVNKILDNEHQNFLDAINRSTLIPPEDKIALIKPAESLVKMNDIKDSVRAFLARYLVQTSFKQLDRLLPSEIPYERIRTMLHEGYAKYLDVYGTDIPLYDKLYEEFDALRESGRSPLEVYLGRDGIYAYIGRKAQDATRKAVLGKEKVEELRTEGEVISIEPKYLVYPSYIRDYVSTETKQEYLTYSGVTQESDPLFYDTGYSGSIPTQIMRIMGFDPAQIEERIRLLSAPTDRRRMRGISANAKTEVIQKIEGNPKSEDTASGLIKNPETGSITHAAEPSSPDDQFQFSLIRQAIARHYLIQEKLHYAVPENTILDSEKFTLRIRSEYAEQLPDAFTKDPIRYLEAQGTPEEGVVLMKLKDGTEVMARRVEWSKTQEAQTEYAILISAKKMGLPAAEPVGFVTGKSTEDESILLSKKIEGVPGRRFEKTLRDSGKYSESKIASLLQDLQMQIAAVTTLLKQTLNITGNWKVNDVAVQFNDETGVIERVIPLKWEQVKRRDEEKERRVRELIKDDSSP